MSLSPRQINFANQNGDDFAAMMDEYPLSSWSSLEDDPTLHPILAQLWRQIKTKLWAKGHPKANDLLHAVYLISQCALFRGGAQ